MVARRRARALVVAIAALGLGGCASTDEEGLVASPTTTDPTASVPTATDPTATGRPAFCTARDVAVSSMELSPGSGHRGLVIQLRNTSGSVCTLEGYADVRALGADGEELGVAEPTMAGYLAGLANGVVQTVRLAPGSTASFAVEALAFRRVDGESGPPYRTLVITLPGDTTSLRVDWVGTDACDALQVHPFVPGETGSVR